jgi:hypothetical protein
MRTVKNKFKLQLTVERVVMQHSGIQKEQSLSIVRRRVMKIKCMLRVDAA